MNTHQVSIRKAGAIRAANMRKVPIGSGDQVTFTAEHSAASILCFSSDLIGLLSPSPAAHVDLPAGTSVSYTIGTASPKEFVVVIQAHGWPPPASVPNGGTSDAPVIALRDPSGKDFPGPGDPPDGA